MSYCSSTVKGSTTSNFYTMQGHRSVGRRSLSVKSQAIRTTPLTGTLRLMCTDPWLRDNLDMGTLDRNSPPLWFEPLIGYIVTQVRHPWLRDNLDIGTLDRSSPPLWFEPLNRSIATLKSPLAIVLVCPFFFAGERFLDQGNTILRRR